MFGKFTFIFAAFFLSLHAFSAPIKIAYFGGLSGGSNQSAQKPLKALKLLVKEFNKKGGVKGTPVEVLAYDNGIEPIKNVALFKKLKKDGVIAIVGLHTSNDGLILSKLAEKYEIPLIVASATNPKVTEGKKYVTRVCFNDDAQGTFLAESAYQRLQARNVAVVVDVSDSFTTYLAKFFSEKFQSLGGKIVGTYSIHTNEKDFTAVINKLKAEAHADLIFLSASALESGYFMADLTRKGIKTPLLGSDGWQNLDLENVLKDQKSVHAYFSAHWYKELDTKESKEFVQAYEAEYGEKLFSFDADPVLTYDAGNLLLTALTQTASLDAKAIMDQVRKTQVNGVTGKIEFTGNTDPKKTLFFLEMANGKVAPAPTVAQK